MGKRLGDKHFDTDLMGIFEQGSGRIEGSLVDRIYGETSTR
jgi:hypothetical protein